MAGIDVSGIIGGQQSSLANAQSQMASDFTQVQQVSDAIVKATKASGDDEVAIATQKAQGLLQAQQAAQQVAASYGGNSTDPSFIMNKLGAQWMDTEQRRLDAEKVVQQKQSVSFMDDPLTWLSNKLTVNTDINNYNNLEEQSNELYDQMNKINTLNTDTARSMQAIATTQTAATVAATADQAAQNANIANSKAQLEGILFNVKGIQDTMQMGQDQVDNAVKGAQTAIAAGHLAVAQSQLVVMQKELSMKADLYQEEIKQKQAQDASDLAVADTVNKGRAAQGLPPVPAAKIFTMFKMGGEAGEALKQQYTAGALSDITGKPMIAPSSGTAARFLATSQSPLATANPATKPIVDLLENSYNTARNPANAQMMGINPKDVSTVDGAVSGIVRDSVTRMASNIKPGDNSNIFQAPPLTSLASLPAVKSNPIYTKVLEPQVKSGMSETNPTQILQLTVDAVNSGQISLSDAVAGYSSLFNAAVKMNSDTKDYTRFGIAPQANYITQINQGGIFGGTVNVDLTNKAQVTTMFMKYMSSIKGGAQRAGYDANATMWDNLYGGAGNTTQGIQSGNQTGAK